MSAIAEKKVLKYNFKRPDRISKNQIRSLHFVHDRFARNFSSSVSAYLRTVVEISLENIGQISYSEFLNTVSDPTCYVAISLKPLDGLAAVEMGPSLVFPMIDRLLGGLGRPIANVRPMTNDHHSHSPYRRKAAWTPWSLLEGATQSATFFTREWALSMATPTPASWSMPTSLGASPIAITASIAMP